MRLFTTFHPFFSIRYLGIILDQEFSFSPHGVHAIQFHAIQLPCNCYHQFRQLCICLSFSPFSLVDLTIFCSVSLRVGLSPALLTINPLTAALSLNMSINMLLSRADTLHWLPVPQRISYKIAAMVWHCIIGIAPTYRLPV